MQFFFSNILSNHTIHIYYVKYKFLKKCLKKSYKSNRNNTSLNLFNKLVQRYLDGKLI